ncbi:MAG: hypothetical protein Q8P61_04720, partial [Candidatus Nanopelagicales bacterium]|nr:hypothetical protein [Candidatus Nanopelagicales bacterium]
MRWKFAPPLTAFAVLSLLMLGGCGGGDQPTATEATASTGVGLEGSLQSGGGRTPVSEPTFIEVGKAPEGIAYASGSVYVANVGGNSVSVVDTAGNKTVATITGAKRPTSVVASPDETRVYVSVLGKKTVAEIDTKSNTIIRRLPGNGGQLAISPDGRWLYQSPGAAGVSRTDLGSGTARELPGTDRTTVYAVSQDGSILYAQRVDSGDNNSLQPHLVRLRATDGTVTRDTPLIADTLWSFAGDMLFDPEFGYLYVSMQGMNDGFSGVSGTTVQRYDPTTLELKGTYDAGRDREVNVELGP